MKAAEMKKPVSAATPTGPYIKLVKETNMNTVAQHNEMSQEVSAELFNTLFEISQIADSGAALALLLSYDDAFADHNKETISAALHDMNKKFSEISNQLLSL